MLTILLKETKTSHSAFKHAFLSIVDTDDTHLIEEFALEAGRASFNKLTIVPLLTLNEGVIPRVQKNARL